jgi:hypothetical protein
MSRPKPASNVFPRYIRLAGAITEITMAGEDIVEIRSITVGTEIITIGLLDPDRIVLDPEAQRRYQVSQSHLDDLDEKREASPAIRLGERLKGRWASGWILWELSREIRRPVLPAPTAEPVAPAIPAKRRGRSPKHSPQPQQVVTA